MLPAPARLARDAGVADAGVVVAENGSVVELAGGRARVIDQVPVGVTFVDGLAVGDVNAIALRDRRHLSEDGVLIVVATVGSENGQALVGPEVIARGFAEPEPVLEEARVEAERTLAELLASDAGELKLLQERLHDAVGRLVYERTRRRPMILPVVLEV